MIFPGTLRRLPGLTGRNHPIKSGLLLEQSSLSYSFLPETDRWSPPIFTPAVPNTGDPGIPGYFHFKKSGSFVSDKIQADSLKNLRNNALTTYFPVPGKHSPGYLTERGLQIYKLPGCPGSPNR